MVKRLVLGVAALAVVAVPAAPASAAAAWVKTCYMTIIAPCGICWTDGTTTTCVALR
jgi:hypothetical protein